jgi:hypothetical protein
VDGQGLELNPFLEKGKLVGGNQGLNTAKSAMKAIENYGRNQSTEQQPT